MDPKHVEGMRHALRLAENAGMSDEVPIGAVIFRDTLMLGQGGNQNIGASDPTAHAEIVALRDACQYERNYRLTDASLYVTLEPCLMCFTAMIHARVGALIYGAADPKSGFTRFLDESALDRFNHRIEITAGVLEDECAEKIQAFFRGKRERGKRKWMRQKGA